MIITVVCCEEVVKITQRAELVNIKDYISILIAGKTDGENYWQLYLLNSSVRFYLYRIFLECCLKLRVDENRTRWLRSDSVPIVC